MGALLDAGLDYDFLVKELKKLELDGYKINRCMVMAGAIKAARFDVEVTKIQEPRTYADIKKIIKESALSGTVKKTALDIFKTIAAAEAVIHGKQIKDVHFHEVGAVDSIIDITAAAIGIHRLGIDKIMGSPVPLGKGEVDTSHGRLPVPAPATLEFLKGVPVYQGDFDFEVTTPTGAGIVKTLVSGFGRTVPMEIESIGYGAGKKSISGHKHHHSGPLPNVLRIITGRELEKEGKEMPFYPADAVLLSANIDDSSPEILGYVMEKLNASEGVMDAWLENIYMKKNRPAFKLCVICSLKQEGSATRLVFKETSTIGIRREEICRYCLAREIKKVKLPYGEVEVKTASLGGKVVNSAPEYESCKKLAEKTGKALKEVYRDIGSFLSMR